MTTNEKDARCKRGSMPHEDDHEDNRYLSFCNASF